jgi:hypothetical protein
MRDANATLSSIARRALAQLLDVSETSAHP